MKPFKFFQKGTLVDPQMLEEITRATASFNTDTPDGHLYRRRLYHTDRELYDRLHNPPNNNEMERYFYDRELRRFETTRPTDNQIKLHQTTRVTRVNPKWWMKIKMFFQKLKTNAVIETNNEVIGIFMIATTVTIIFGLMIAKVLNIW